MVEAGHASDEEVKDQSFIECPAILDKYKAAALIADGTLTQTFLSLNLCWDHDPQNLVFYKKFGMSHF